MRNFFISANSRNGFISLYDCVFDNAVFDKIFVILGGPGTGKSTLMRRVAATVEGLGGTAEYFYCSSDVHSLDGVILSKGKKRVGILDGTPPHARTVTAPAVTEEIWNLGEFWSLGPLEAQKATIEKTSVEKARAYRRAYAFLSAAGALHTEGYATAAQAFHYEKAAETIRRRLPTLSRKGERTERLLRCFAMQGERVAPNGMDEVRKLIPLRGNHYSAEVYLSVFASILSQEHTEHLLLRSPLDAQRADGIYFPATGILLCKESLLSEDAKGRGLHLSAYEEEMLDRRFLKQIAKEEKRLTGEAEDALRTVKENHFALERVFSSAMDFEKMRKQSEKWESCVLAALGLS